MVKEKYEPFINLARKVHCPKLIEQLFEMWEWDPNYVYRAIGKLVTSNNIMMKHLNWNETQSNRIPGVAYPSQRIAVFDLTAAVMINQDGRQKDNLLEDEYNK